MGEEGSGTGRVPLLKVRECHLSYEKVGRGTYLRGRMDRTVGLTDISKASEKFLHDPSFLLALHSMVPELTSYFDPAITSYVDTPGKVS